MRAFRRADWVAAANPALGFRSSQARGRKRNNIVNASCER